MGTVRLAITLQGGTYIPFGTNCVYLIDENNTRSVFLSHTEEFSDEFWTVTEVLLDQLRSHHPQERRRRLVRDRFGKQCLPSTWDSIQDNAFWRFDTHFFV